MATCSRRISYIGTSIVILIRARYEQNPFREANGITYYRISHDLICIYDIVTATDFVSERNDNVRS